MKRIIRLLFVMLLISTVPGSYENATAASSLAKTSHQKFKPVMVILDRFEGRFAIVELPGRRMVNLPKSLVPKGSVEGCVLRISVIRPGHKQ